MQVTTSATDLCNTEKIPRRGIHLRFRHLCERELSRSPLSLITRNTLFNNPIHTLKTSLKVNCTAKVFIPLQRHKPGQMNFTFSISTKYCPTRHSSHPLSSTTASATSFFYTFLQCQAQRGSFLTCSFQISPWRELLNRESQSYSCTPAPRNLLVTCTYPFLIDMMNVFNFLKKLNRCPLLCCSTSKRKIMKTI